MRVGAMGFVVPLHHPLRLAEEIAIVDQMLGGRFECGLVPGISPGFFTPFGIDYNFRKSPTFEFVIPTGISSIPYFCIPHCAFGMTGTITVMP
jgi:hypothetical protein